MSVPPLRIAERGTGGEAGYALLAVLWITVGITGLAGLVSAAARLAIAPARNRIALTAASWHAAACLAHARATLAEADESTPQAWDHVDRTLSASPPPAELGCELEARPVGSRLDVNAADEPTLVRLFRLVGTSDSLADAHARAIARHKPYVDLRQVHVIPGLGDAHLLDSVLDVEPGPIALNHAPAAVLLLLPGFTQQTVERVLDARARDAPISSFHELSQLLSADVPDASAHLPGVAVFQPTAWVVAIRARAGRPPVTAVLEVRLAKAGFGTTVARRKAWIE